MRVTVHFADGEVMHGSSEAMTLGKSGFPVKPDEGNNDMVWVSLAAMKYVVIHAASPQPGVGDDPRAALGLPKAVIRFADGETIRTYRDDSWGQEAEGFALRLWDPEQQALVRVLVSMHSVKGVFFVREWDSRTDEERLHFSRQRRRGAAPAAGGAGAAAPAPSAADRGLAVLADRYRRRLAEVGDRKLATGTPAEFAEAVRRHLSRLLKDDELTLNADDQRALAALVLQNALGYGPLDPLLLDPKVTEIMVNGPRSIFVERDGRIQRARQFFESEAGLLEVIKKMAANVGRRIDESNPMVDARLPDGSRLNAVIPPASIDGPVLTIRRFAPGQRSLEDLVAERTLTMPAALFLHDAVLGRTNLLVSGGTGSGKTTTLNVLGALVPDGHRVVTIEDTAELQLAHPHVVRLEYRPANVEGREELTIRQLLKNSLRMRPDRIIIGEVRADEALDMLQAMNTGHDGSMSTIHANSARDALVRLETMVMGASFDLPLSAVRAQVMGAIDLVVHQARREDGRRQIVQIAELSRFADDGPVLQSIFEIDRKGVLAPTGVVPRCLAKMALYDVQAELSYFEKPKPGAAPAAVPVAGPQAGVAGPRAAAASRSL